MKTKPTVPVCMICKTKIRSLIENKLIFPSVSSISEMKTKELTEYPQIKRCKCGEGVYSVYKKENRCLLSNGQFNPRYLEQIPTELRLVL